MKRCIGVILILFITLSFFLPNSLLADKKIEEDMKKGADAAAGAANNALVDAGVIEKGTVDNPDSPSNPSNGNASVGKLSSATGKIWSTFAIVAQMLAITAIIFTGLRYMLTNADDRADIKMQTILLVIGASLVFAAVPFANFIIDVVNQTIK